MSILYFNNSINEIKSKSDKSVRGTLLVPKMYLKKLDELRYKKSLSIENLIIKFSFLIEKNIIHIPPNLNKHTTLYQNLNKNELSLIRCHLRCIPMVWHHWKRLANHFGLSMCNLFFICLKNVTLKDLESVGTPTDSYLIHNFTFNEITNFTKSYSHRWFFSRRYKKKFCKLRKKLLDNE